MALTMLTTLALYDACNLPALIGGWNLVHASVQNPDQCIWLLVMLSITLVLELLLLVLVIGCLQDIRQASTWVKRLRIDTPLISLDFTLRRLSILPDFVYGALPMQDMNSSHDPSVMNVNTSGRRLGGATLAPVTSTTSGSNNGSNNSGTSTSNSGVPLRVATGRDASGNFVAPGIARPPMNPLLH